MLSVILLLASGVLTFIQSQADREAEPGRSESGNQLAADPRRSLSNERSRTTNSVSATSSPPTASSPPASMSTDNPAIDERPCQNYYPRNGLLSPPSSGDVMMGLGGRPDVLDGRIVDTSLDDAPRMIAVNVEAPTGLGTISVPIDLGTKIQRRCEKGQRMDLRCGRYVRVLFSKKSSAASMVYVINESDLGQQLDCRSAS